MNNGVYLKAFLATLIVFSAGIATGWWLDQTRIAVAQAELEDLKIQADEARLSLLYLETFKDSPGFCANYGSQLTSQLEGLGALGERLTALQAANKLDSSFYRIKKQYALFSVEFWMHASNYARECNASLVPILYFYPENAACPDCSRQASELNAVKKECPERAWVFAVPIDLDLNAVNALRMQYGLTSVPSLVVGEKAFDGYASREQIDACA
ncbi:MAG: hypothetical protein WC607_02835 [Candidatus Micrarchaeia archaeon]